MALFCELSNQTIEAVCDQRVTKELQGTANREQTMKEQQ